jgi:hypothetical protein
MSGRETLKEIEDLRKDFIKAREEFLVSIPPLYRNLVKWAVENFPKDKLQAFIDQTALELAEFREETKEKWNVVIDGISAFLKKQLKDSTKPEEFEERILAIVDLFREALRYLLEELKVIKKLEEELNSIK